MLTMSSPCQRGTMTIVYSHTMNNESRVYIYLSSTVNTKSPPPFNNNRGVYLCNNYKLSFLVISERAINAKAREQIVLQI